MEKFCCVQNRAAPSRPLWKKALIGAGELLGGVFLFIGLVITAFFLGHIFGQGVGNGLLDALKPEKTVQRKHHAPRPPLIAVTALSQNRR